ncbi:MAG TPA: GNAT family N-acetyltransferase [Kineosporiaceae bacterium]|nr:GNAT family N-acetyltransferase [Kineosporiaceae bacterium]
MTSVALRAARLADIPAVLDFWKVAAEDTNRADSDSAPALERLLERDPGALLLAEVDGQIVGSLIAGWDGWRCHLYRFAVHPDQRRRGIGRALLDAAERRFAGFGGHRVDAMVLADNTIAHPAWAASGYAPQPEWARWVKPLPGVGSRNGHPI